MTTLNLPMAGAVAILILAYMAGALVFHTTRRAGEPTVRMLLRILVGVAVMLSIIVFPLRALWLADIQLQIPDYQLILNAENRWLPLVSLFVAAFGLAKLRKKAPAPGADDQKDGTTF